MWGASVPRLKHRKGDASMQSLGGEGPVEQMVDGEVAEAVLEELPGRIR